MTHPVSRLVGESDFWRSVSSGVVGAMLTASILFSVAGFITLAAVGSDGSKVRMGAAISFATFDALLMLTIAFTAWTGFMLVDRRTLTRLKTRAGWSGCFFLSICTCLTGALLLSASVGAWITWFGVGICALSYLVMVCAITDNFGPRTWIAQSVGWKVTMLSGACAGILASLLFGTVVGVIFERATN